ncbi:SH3 domain-containing protein [Mesorhizobium sp. CU2]|nr:SH3 domain-containing protein [Mesorhizobium sp. CU3]TPO10717.1 SH3 domain-containing protein [Mesorhizobium sp. CU2]
MQFGYNVRPSFWQSMQSNAHLVIAGIGTIALLGVAGVALWLSLPGNDRQVAAATSVQTVPTIPVKTTKIAPVAATVTVATTPQAAQKADAVAPANAARQADIAALASNNPRWTASGAQTQPGQPEAQPAPSGQAANPTAEQKPTDTAFAEPAAASDASTALSQLAPPTDAKKPEDKMDSAKTAAIPEAKPDVPDDQPAADSADTPKPKAQKASAVASGRILRAVTMRSGPKKGAGAITTVPAKASVQVLSCKKWCEIVYNGKRGWIYKSYIKTGA